MRELNTAARGKISASRRTPDRRARIRKKLKRRDGLRYAFATSNGCSRFSFFISQPCTLAVDPEPQASRSMRRPDLRFAPNKSGRPFGESHGRSALQQLVVAEERLRVSRRSTRANCSKRLFASLPSRNARPVPHVDVVQGTRSLLVLFLSLIGENYDADQRRSQADIMAL